MKPEKKLRIPPVAQTCPTCRAEISRDGRPPAYPFCSERCRAIDLARWLEEGLARTDILGDDDYRFFMSNAEDHVGQEPAPEG